MHCFSSLHLFYFQPCILKKQLSFPYSLPCLSNLSNLTKFKSCKKNVNTISITPEQPSLSFPTGKSYPWSFTRLRLVAINVGRISSTQETKLVFHFLEDIPQKLPILGPEVPDDILAVEGEARYLNSGCTDFSLDKIHGIFPYFWKNFKKQNTWIWFSKLEEIH